MPVTFEEGSQDACDYGRAISYVTPIDKEKYRGLLPETVLAAAPTPATTCSDWSDSGVHVAGPGTAVYEEFRRMDQEDDD